MPARTHATQCAALVALALLLAGALPARAAPDAAVRTRPDLLAVRLAPATSSGIAGRSGARVAGAAPRLAASAGPFGTMASRLGLTLEPQFPLPGPSASRASRVSSQVRDRLARDWLVHLPAGLTAERALELLRGLPDVESADLVHLVPVESVPDDSLWSKEYYFYQPSRRDVHALEAWDITRGDSSQIIAIIDTGVLLTHPDLAGPGPGIGGNIWTSVAEATGQASVDDDGNGYVDDVHGWDFIDLPDTTFAVKGEDWRDEDNDPNDFVGHGTGVAGVAAALTNNHLGVAGAAPGARIMPLRVGFSAVAQPAGLIDESAAARAIVYAARTGATVINCSFSSTPATDLMDALDFAYQMGVVVVVAAGNNHSSHAMGDRPEVISVAATDANDRLTLFTNTGSYVDVSAAGLFLSTTTLDRAEGADSASRCRPAYSATASGTSFSSPLVSGEVALIQAQRHARGLAPLDPISVRLRLVETADDISGQNPGATGYGSGRVNFLRALSDPAGSYAVWLGSAPAGAAAVARSASGACFAVIGTRAGRLIRVDAATRAIAWNVALPGPAGGSPSAADLGGGRGLGIFVAVSSGAVCGFDEAGQPLPGWPVAASCPPGSVASPAIADVDGDGAPDIVWGDANGQVWAWHSDGRALAGFPVTAGTSSSNIWIALADLDGDGASEIVAASTTGPLSVFAGDGRPAGDWAPDLSRHLTFQHPPMVALLGDDPRPAIVATEQASGGDFLRVLNPDRSQRWVADFSGLASGSSAIADVDGDGRPEVLVYRGTGDVYIARGTGTFFESTNTAAGAIPTSLVPELIVGQGAPGRPHVAWSFGGSLFAYDASSATLSAAQRFGDGTPTYVDFDGDSLLEIVAPSGAVGALYVYPTGVPARGNEQLWPTGRANAARTGSIIPPGARIDDSIPPRAVTDLRLVAVRSGEVELAWTAPADRPGRGAARYDMRRSPGFLSAGNFGAAPVVPSVPQPSAPGAAEHVRVTAVPNDAITYFALESTDSAGNVSAISNVIRVPPVTPFAVAGLRITRAGRTTIEVAWTSTGSNGRDGHAASYELRASRQLITAANFNQAEASRTVVATRDSGLTESGSLIDLLEGNRYWVAMRAVDSLGYVSPLSNVVSTVTAPSILPLTVNDLHAVGAGTSTLTLSWTSTGRSGRGGDAAAYDIGASRQPIDSTNFDQAEVRRLMSATRLAGRPDSVRLFDLSAGSRYWIVMRSIDSTGYESALSNVDSANTLPARVTDLSVTSSTKTSCALVWTSTGNIGSDGRRVAVEIRASLQPLDPANFDRAAIRLERPAIPAGGVDGVELVGLDSGHRYSIALRAVDSLGNTSDLSNIATVATAPEVYPVAVTDLHVNAAGSRTLELAWTSTGSDGRAGHAAAYDLRVSDREIDARTYELAEFRLLIGATSPAGVEQGVVLPEQLTPDRQYWLAVRAIDSLGYQSPLSNVVATRTGPSIGPKRIGDLRVASAGATTLELAWTSTGTSGTGGEADKYELRVSERPIDATNFGQVTFRHIKRAMLAAGLETRVEFPGLAPGRRYWIALRALDAQGFVSPVSNVVSAVPGPLAGRSGAGLTIANSLAGPPVTLFWQIDAASASQAARIRLFDAGGRACRTITVPAATEGIATWDGASDAGARMPAGVYFARLETRSSRAATRFVLLR